MRTKKEIIINLYKIGLSNKKIAEMTNVTERYVRKIIQIVNTPKILTEKNYITTIKYGIKSKEELASYFGVSRMTLYRFEETTGINKKLLRCLYTEGKTLEKITSLLNTKITETEINHLKTLPTIAGIKGDIQKVMNVLLECVPYDTSIEKTYNKLKRIYKEF